MRHPDAYQLGMEIGSLLQRVTAIEDKVRKLDDAGNTTRRLLLLLALSTAASLGNIKADMLGELLAAVLKSALKI